MLAAMSFNFAWLLSAAVLIALFALFGRFTRTSVTGLLVDSRERYSLNHFQISLWSFLVLSTLLAAFISSGFDAAALALPEQLVILMGISVGSAVASGAVKGMKDGLASAEVARRGKRVKRSDGTAAEIDTRPAQLLLVEEGDQADQVVSITKFQNFVLTIVVAFAYVVLAIKAQGYPTLPEQVLWLIGISHAGYVAGKIPKPA